MRKCNLVGVRHKDCDVCSCLSSEVHVMSAPLEITGLFWDTWKAKTKFKSCFFYKQGITNDYKLQLCRCALLDCGHHRRIPLVRVASP